MADPDTATKTMPAPKPEDHQAGQQVGGVRRVGRGPREQERADGGDAKSETGHDPGSGVSADVGGAVGAHDQRGGQGQEAQAGLEGGEAQDRLHEDRAEEHRADEHTGHAEHDGACRRPGA